MTDKHDHPHLNLPIPVTLSPVYSNVMTVSHNQAEFLCCFGLLLSNQHQVQAHTLVALTPGTAKMVLLALVKNISRYEDRFGEIEVSGE